MPENETEHSDLRPPDSVDLDGDPAWAHLFERDERYSTPGSAVALSVAQTTGVCNMGERHGICATQHLSAAEARKLAAALLNAADELDALGQG